MKNKKMIFKRVAATLGLILTLIPLMVLGVAADAVESTEAPYTKLCNALGKKLQSTDIMFLKNRYTDPSTLGMVFYQSYFDDNNLTEVMLNNKTLKDFKTGYVSNVRAGLGSWRLEFNWWGTVNEDYGGEWNRETVESRGVIYYTIRYDGVCLVTFWANADNDGGVRKVTMLYDSYEVGTDRSGNSYCLYSLNDIEILYDDNTAKRMKRDYGDYEEEPYLSEVMIAFEGACPNVPDYSLATLLGIDVEISETFFSSCYSPSTILRYYNGIYGSGYGKGYQFGEYDGYELGEENGRAAGYKQGYQIGFGEGETSALNGTNTFGDLVIGIFEAPGVLVDSMLDFNIFGINVAGFVKVLLTLAVTAAIVFFVIKIKG